MRGINGEATASGKHRVVAITMEESETIQCPFCGQAFELSIDTSVPSQRFVTDCEICCRPFNVTVECEPGEIISLSVE